MQGHTDAYMQRGAPPEIWPETGSPKPESLVDLTVWASNL